MNEFKEGDRVRVTNAGKFHWLNGRCGTVAAPPKKNALKGRISVTLDGTYGPLYFAPAELELLEPPGQRDIQYDADGVIVGYAQPTLTPTAAQDADRLRGWLLFMRSYGEQLRAARSLSASEVILLQAVEAALEGEAR